MREIKFRAWDKIDKCMIYPDHLHPTDECLDTFSYPQVIPCWFTETKDRLFLEYTGLKDKNGQEIYEGDVIRRHLNLAIIYGPEGDEIRQDVQNPELVAFIGVVKFSSTTGWYLDCRLPIQKPDGYCRIRRAKLTRSATRSEVIGTIHENPQLLEMT